MKIKLPKLDYYKILKHITITIDILFVFLLLFNYLSFLPEFWNANMIYIWFFIVAVNTGFLAFKINKIPEAVRDKSSMIYYFSHFFLLSLVIIALNQFLKRQIIIDFMPEITALSIGLGFLTFYAYRNKVEREIEDEKETEEKKEKKRGEEFGRKFPKINKIWGLRNIVRWMYKEGWGYSVGLLAIVVLGFVLRIWNLGEVSFWFDEILHLSVEGLIPRYPLGDIYNRAFITTYMIKIFTKIFTLNEFYARLPSVIFSACGILFSYILARKFVSKNFSLLIAFLVSVSVFSIVFSQEARYYSWLAFCLILSMIIILKKNKSLVNYFLILFLFIAGLDASFIFLLVIIPVLLLYVNFKNLFKSKFIILGLIFLGGFIVYYIFHQNLFKSLSFNSFYLSFLNPWFLIPLVSIIPLFKRKHIIIFLPLFFTIFVLTIVQSHLVPSYRYLAHFYNILILFSVLLLYFLFKLDFIKTKKILKGFIIILILFLSFTNLYFFEFNSFMQSKEELVWAKPDYKSWKDITLSNNSIIISNVPHIAKYYLGHIDYCVADNSFEISKYNKDVELRSGANLITLNKIQELHGEIFIFSDYKKNYMWDPNTYNYIQKNFEKINESYRTTVYYKKQN